MSHTSGVISPNNVLFHEIDTSSESGKVSISWTIMSTESNNNFHAVNVLFVFC